MRIIKLQAENVKKLRAIEITPDGPIVKISGKNAAGKSTVLDSITWALGGTKAVQAQPIREGENHAFVSLDLGDYLVLRTFTPSGSTLRVTNKEGATYKSPQALLDQFIGRLSFDPMSFARADAKTQRAMLLEVTGIAVDNAKLQEAAGTLVLGDNAIDTINSTYAAVFAERTAVNRQADQAKKSLARLTPVQFTEPVSVSELAAEQADLAENQRCYDACALELRQLRIQDEGLSAQIAALARQLQEANELQMALHRDIHLKKEELASRSPSDFSGIQDRLAHADEKNRQAQQWQEYQSVSDSAAELSEQANALTARLNAIKAYQQDLVEHAAFPVDGLSFGGNGVLYNGLPLEQASSAQRLQVSLAVAMALNPELRVIRIDDGSLLDTEHLAIIEKMAADQDMQIWMEVMDESGNVGFYIEEGQVAAHGAV